MNKSLEDCMPAAFEQKFGGNAPEEIHHREVKQLRTTLNLVAEQVMGHQFPRRKLRVVIDEYIVSRGYQKVFNKRYHELNLPQWTYRLSS